MIIETIKKIPNIRLFIYLFVIFESLQRIFSFNNINLPINKIFLSGFLLFISYQSFKKKAFSKGTIYFFILMFFLILNILIKRQIFIDNLELSMFGFPFFFIIVSYVLKNRNFIQKKDILYISYYIAILILLGIVFKLNIFRTYIFDLRFGYSGLIRSSIISIIAFSLYSLLVNKDYQKFIFFLIGTKAFYLGSLLFEFKNILKTRKFIKPLLFIITIPLILYQNDAFRNTINGFISLNQKKGLLTSILSYRDLLVQNTWSYILENWHWYNYLIGDPTLFYKYKTEMAFFDLFFNFGIIGFLGFITILVLLVSKYINYNYLIILLIAFIIGNFFTSPMAIFFSSLVLTTNNNES